MRLRIFFKGFLSLAVLAAPSFAAGGDDEVAAKHEIGLTLGGLAANQRVLGASRLDLGSGVALQANYGYRLLGRQKAALYGEVHFLANPLRDVTSSSLTVTRDVATIFLTPGIRFKLFPASAIAPYAVAGGGWAVFEQSTNTLDGRPNPASRLTNHGAFMFGGGVDFRLWRFIGLRTEIRDFYTGSPSYNLAGLRGGQHNLVAGGGLVLKLSAR